MARVAQPLEELQRRNHELTERVAQLERTQQLALADLRLSYERLAHAHVDLLERERLATVGELAAVMAHEVRNPLAVLFNALAALRRVVPTSAQSDRLLDIAAEESERLNRIIEDLLQLAGDGAAVVREQPLELVVPSALETARRAFGEGRVELAVEMGELPGASVDAPTLRQALSNVVLDALHAGPEGGRVTVSSSAELLGERRFLRIDVCGTRSLPPGPDPSTGLGVTLARRLIEPQGGLIRVHPTDGASARTTLLFPLGSAADAAGPSEPSPGATRL